MNDFKEVGLIVNAEGIVISFIVGEPSKVEFDTELLVRKHLDKPGKWTMIHTHPPGCVFFSELDYEVIRGVCKSISPHKLRFSIFSGIYERTVVCSWKRGFGCIASRQKWRKLDVKRSEDIRISLHSGSTPTLGEIIKFYSKQKPKVGRTVPPRDFCETLEKSVDNDDISDEEFREVVRDSLSVVDYK